MAPEETPKLISNNMLPVRGRVPDGYAKGRVNSRMPAVFGKNHAITGAPPVIYFLFGPLHLAAEPHGCAAALGLMSLGENVTECILQTSTCKPI